VFGESVGDGGSNLKTNAMSQIEAGSKFSPSELSLAFIVGGREGKEVNELFVTTKDQRCMDSQARDKTQGVLRNLLLGRGPR